MRFAAVMILVGALAACGCGSPEPGYPPGYELNFMRACEAQGALAEFCACTWDKIEADVAPGDFAALELVPAGERQAHPLQLQIERYAEACRAPAP